MVVSCIAVWSFFDFTQEFVVDHGCWWGQFSSIFKGFHFNRDSWVRWSHLTLHIFFSRGVEHVEESPRKNFHLIWTSIWGSEVQTLIIYQEAIADFQSYLFYLEIWDSYGSQDPKWIPRPQMDPKTQRKQETRSIWCRWPSTKTTHPPWSFERTVVLRLWRWKWRLLLPSLLFHAAASWW